LFFFDLFVFRFFLFVCLQVKVLYFAQSRELVNASEEEFEFPAAALTGAELLERLLAARPGLAILRDALMLARNEEYIDMDGPTTLAAGDTIALIPPLSGG
jgi:molybdopterin converting factor subunit 1